MFNMKSDLRERAIELRKKKRLSYGAIAKKLKVAKSTLSYWLSDLPLSHEEILKLRRSAWRRGEASRESYRNTMRHKRDLADEAIYKAQREKVLPLSERDLYFSGLMLYVGEGDKRNRHRIALANSDPFVVSFFTKWLQKFLSISKKDIKFGLHLYANMNIAKERKFWQDTLGFERNSFYKDQIREVTTAFSYAEGSRHGTCTVYVIGSRPKTEIMQTIRVFADNALVVQW